MPKAILEFNLPEEELEYQDAIGGVDFKCALLSFERFLRDTLKYQELPKYEAGVYEDIRKKFNECLDEYNVRLYE